MKLDGQAAQRCNLRRWLIRTYGADGQVRMRSYHHESNYSTAR